MASIWVREFTGGLDTQRLPETTEGGVLVEALNGHITSGGEFEKRAAFVNTYTVAGTVGLAQTSAGIVVFGHTTDPGVPSGVTYQQLVHPTIPATALVSVPSYDLYGGKIYAVAVFANGDRFHYYDGANVTDWYDGRAIAVIQVVSEGTDVGTAEVSSITIDGVEILDGAVEWDTTLSDTAAAIASSITLHTSSPDYEAISVGATVVIRASDAGTAANGRGVVVTVANGMVIDPLSTVMTGGSAPTNTYPPGQFVKTINSKVYSLSGPNLHFSGVAQPTRWTPDVTGAGFIDMSTWASGSEELVALGKYQTFLAIFSDSTIQIWFVESDPANNSISRVLESTGTLAPGSVTQFGDEDLFYLDASGLRSLRARDSSNAPSRTDVGVAIDTLVVEQLESLNAQELTEVTGLIEPRGGRFWLVMKDKIFVFSFYQGRVSAWSLYEPGFDVTAAVVHNRRIYLRSGNSIYVYGGLTSALTYDDTLAVGQTPFLDANDPSKAKSFKSIDLACRGEWAIDAYMNAGNQDARDRLAIVSGTTFGAQKLPFNHEATHVSIRFSTQSASAAKMGSIVLHYDGDGDEDQ